MFKPGLILNTRRGGWRTNGTLRGCLPAVAVALATTLASFPGGPAATAQPAPAGTNVSLPASPQRVVLDSIEAAIAGNAMSVHWETAIEFGVLGFHLERFAGGDWQRVNRSLLPAAESMSGGRYAVLDPGTTPPGPHRYRLSAILITGETSVLGVFDLVAARSLAPEEVRLQHSEPRLTLTPRDPAPEPARPVALAQPATPIHLPTSEVRVKIRTQGAGLHFVRASDLGTLLGQTTATVTGWLENGQVALSNRGLPVTYVPGNRRDADGYGLFFYAEENRNNYTYQNVYWLGAGANNLELVDGGNPNPVADSGWYATTYVWEEDNFSVAHVVFDPEADFWMWRSLLASRELVNGQWVVTEPTSSFTDLPLTQGVNSETALLRVAVRGGSTAQHRVRAFLNSELLGDRLFSGLVADVLEYAIPAGVLASANTLTLQAMVPEGASGQVYSQVYINSLEFRYSRSYHAEPSMTVHAATEGRQIVSVRGFDSDQIMVFAFSTPKHPKLVQKTRIDTVSGSERRVSFNTRGETSFVAFQPATAAASRRVFSSSLSLASPTDLADPATRAAYLVLAPPGLTSGAEALAAYRGRQMRTRVVVLDDVYNEFSHGLVTPHAIWDFLSSAYENWALPPRYLVLVGDGTWDYRNLLSGGSNLMPPLMIGTDFGLFTSDSLYGNVLKDGVSRVSVGRLPVTSQSELERMLVRIQSYESELVPAPLKALLVADRPDSAGDFVAQIRTVAGYLSPRYASEEVYPEPYPLTSDPPPVDVNAMRTGIQQGLNGGVDLMCYVGHGAVQRFGSQGYLTTADVPLLANSARLPVVVAMTCVAGQYSNPGGDCLTEALVTGLSTTGKHVGAIAALSATGLSYDNDGAWLNRRVMQVLARTESGRLGDIMIQVFSLYNNWGSPRLTNVWMYNLLGDPGLMMLIPTSSP